MTEADSGVQPKTVLFHDGNDLTALAVECLEATVPGSISKMAVEDFRGDLFLAEQVVVVADLRRPRPIHQVQRACLHSATDFLLIGLEPGFCWLGPYVTSRHSGCFRCLNAWLNNNYRDTSHWSNPSNWDDTSTRRLPAPLAPPVLKIVSNLLKAALAACRQGAYPLLNTVVRFDLKRLLTSRHRYIAEPSCPDCSRMRPDDESRGALAMVERLKPDADTYRAAGRGPNAADLRDRFVDRHTGLVKHVFNSITSDLMPMYAAELPIMRTGEVESGYGRMETRRDSEVVSILEALERYTGHRPRGARSSVRASFRQVKDRAIDPRSLILHRPEQFAEPGFQLQPYSERLEYNWVWGYSFRRGGPILVPEQSAYYFLLNDGMPANRFVYETSNGCALGGSREEAALYGLLELVERDAYLTTWYGRFVPVEIDLAGIDDERVRLLRLRCEAQALALHAFDIRHDIDVPIVWCMVVDTSGDAPVKSYCAAGSHFLPGQAIHGALVEVTTSIGVYRRSMPAMKGRALDMFQDERLVRSMHDHVLLYSLPESFPRLEFLFGSRPHPRVRDGAEIYRDYDRPRNLDLTDDLRWLVDRVLAVAEDVIVVDQGFPDLADCGLHSVKVLAPGLLPVSFGHQYRRISLERINLAARTHRLPEFASIEQLNPYPHNFP